MEIWPKHFATEDTKEHENRLGYAGIASPEKKQKIHSGISQLN